ncbi:MAG TPA: glycosyltransferase family 4 protein [Vicinamibacterales bacterium]|nr:glycosyltransferase family 4 protein [Vicinamibacterales bacterium]
MTEWHVITGEYPPQPGGVSDYTRLVAEELVRAGDSVTVWAPPCSPQPAALGSVTVHRLPDHFGWRSLRHLTRALAGSPRRLLVQYVPHAFGWRGANLPFCRWLRSRRSDSVWVMFHEVAYPFSRDDSVAHNALAIVNRMMAGLVARAAERMFVSIPAWQPLVRQLNGAHPVAWLPVPSGVPVTAEACDVSRIRARYAYGSPLVGHFGTYGGPIGSLVDPAMDVLLERTRAQVLLLGRRSDEVAREFERTRPRFNGRVTGAGQLAPQDVSNHIAACDVMMQPYPDGVSTRRTSAMAALAHGRPIVTTTGWLTERLWEESEAVALVAVDAPDQMAAAVARLLDDEPARRALSERARALYTDRFDVSHTIRALRAPR